MQSVAFVRTSFSIVIFLLGAYHPRVGLTQPSSSYCVHHQFGSTVVRHPMLMPYRSLPAFRSYFLDISHMECLGKQKCKMAVALLL